MPKAVDSCSRCEAPVAPDQRYCLNCGERVGERRLDPLALLRAGRGKDGAPASLPAAPERPAPAPAGRWSPRALGASGLALLVGGALIGAAFAPGPAGSLASSAGQIIVVGAPAGAGAGGSSGGGGSGATFAPSEPPVPAAPAPAPAQPAAPAPAPVPQSEPPAPAPAPAPQPEPPAPEKPSIGHVFLVVLPGGPGAEAAFADDAPSGYVHDELVPKGQVLTGYDPVGTGALSNRIALVSGQEPTPDTEADCPDYDGCVYPAETKTLADQLSTWGFEWRAYVEGMEVPCRHPDTEDPFVYFHSVVDLADCSQKVLPLDQMQPALQKPSRTAMLNLVAPTTGSTVDEQLEPSLKPILASKAYRKDGLVVVVFDHAPDALLLSPFVKGGTTNDKPYGHYSLLKTIEDRLGLGEHLGHAADKGVHAFGKDVFDTDLDPYQDPGATVAVHERRRR